MGKLNTAMNKYITPVPKHLKNKLERNFVVSNYSRILPASIILVIGSLSLGNLESDFLGIDVIRNFFVLFSLLFIPIIYQIWKRKDTVSVQRAQWVQGIYFFVLMMTTAAIVLGVRELSFLHIYLMTVFGIAITLEMHPVRIFFLILPTHLLTVYMVPYTNNDPNVIRTLLVNISFSNLASLFLSVAAYNNRVSAFVSKELLVEKNELLADLAKRDGMTGLYNHKASFKKLKREMAASTRTDSALSIILLDIDDFKKVNDTYGHLTGDSILRKISDLMEQLTRETDIIGRYGGEEFLLILPGTDLDGARVLAQKIQTVLDSTSFEQAISITVSGGISQYSDESVDQLIRRTDQKLYRAKQTGKNRFVHCINEKMQLSQNII